VPLGGDTPRTRAPKRGTPIEIVILPLLAHLASKRLQLETDLLRIIRSTADELFSGTNIDDLEQPWTPNIGVFSDFLAILGWIYTLRDWIAPKPFKIDQESMRMKCSALYVDFNGVMFDHLGSRSPPYECIKVGYPLEKVRFLLLSTNLAREWLHIDTRHRLAAYHHKHC